jgi:hypothetical protein
VRNGEEGRERGREREKKKKKKKKKKWFLLGVLKSIA